MAVCLLSAPRKQNIQWEDIDILSQTYERSSKPFLAKLWMGQKLEHATTGKINGKIGPKYIEEILLAVLCHSTERCQDKNWYTQLETTGCREALSSRPVITALDDPQPMLIFLPCQETANQISSISDWSLQDILQLFSLI